MKQFYCYDDLGYYRPGEDIVSDHQPPRSTDVPPLDADGRGMYLPRFVEGRWIEDGQAPQTSSPTQPTLDERVATLEDVTNMLLLGGL